jgi:hypothetical protein
MQLQMTYTVEEENALLEAARILGNAGTILEEAIAAYKEAIALLSNTTKDDSRPLDKTATIAEATLSLSQFRKKLLELDTRAADLTQILEALDNYWRNGGEDALASAAELPSE